MVVGECIPSLNSKRPLGQMLNFIPVIEMGTACLALQYNQIPDGRYLECV